ncbi:MAG: glycosyltransferase family 4 protein [Desulfobacteraceae bacterium]|nr:MAG: glycosyltransferase family 4 protein [Desulfobacteraceae bacterium]
MVKRHFLKILKLCYEYPPLGGGGGHVVYGLSKQLAAMGHHVDLVTMKYKGLPHFEQAENFSIRRVPCLRHSPVICHPHELISYLCTALPTALKMTTETPYDIIHAHFIFPDGILAYLLSKITGIPYLITSHGSDVPGFNPDRFIRLHKILRPLWKRIVGSCSQVICITRYIETLLKQAMPEARTVIIPNGFFPGRFRTGKQKQDRILIVTRMFKRKGVQHFLAAVDGLVMNHEIHIVGDGPHLDTLKQQAEAMTTRVQFHGFLENSSAPFGDLMETSKIFVFPSESDNFPIVLLEAMDAGMAIITTKNTGCEEVVDNTALLVSPGDTEGLRQALIKYLGDSLLCEQSVEKARRRLDENFTWDAVAKKYVNIYDKVLKTNYSE